MIIFVLKIFRSKTEKCKINIFKLLFFFTFTFRKLQIKQGPEKDKLNLYIIKFFHHKLEDKRTVQKLNWERRHKKHKWLEFSYK